MLNLGTDYEERFRDFQLEGRTIFKDIIKSLKELEFCWQCYNNVEYFEVEFHDHEWVDFYALARLEEFERQQKTEMKEDYIDYIYRFIALNVVKERLKQYEIQPFEKPYEGSFDFAIRTRDKGIITLEVVSIPPDYYKPPAEERYIVKNFIMSERKWKKCDYAVGVKILEIKVKDNSIIGKGAIVGYLSKEEIEGIPLRKKGEYPCTKFSGRSILISELNPPKKLWNILEEKAITTF